MVLLQPLKNLDLADKYDAMVMIDECHATGFIERQEKARLRLKE
jgi:7-keto-8-aminopelargonate synthetase-like enzyme